MQHKYKYKDKNKLNDTHTHTQTQLRHERPTQYMKYRKKDGERAKRKRRVIYKKIEEEPERKRE